MVFQFVWDSRSQNIASTISNNELSDFQGLPVTEHSVEILKNTKTKSIRNPPWAVPQTSFGSVWRSFCLRETQKRTLPLPILAQFFGDCPSGHHFPSNGRAKMSIVTLWVAKKLNFGSQFGAFFESGRESSNRAAVETRTLLRALQVDTQIEKLAMVVPCFLHASGTASAGRVPAPH